MAIFWDYFRDYFRELFSGLYFGDYILGTIFWGLYFGDYFGNYFGNYFGDCYGNYFGEYFGDYFGGDFGGKFSDTLDTFQKPSSIDLVSTHFLKLRPIFFGLVLTINPIHKIQRFYLNELILARNQINSYPNLILFL